VVLFCSKTIQVIGNCRGRIVNGRQGHLFVSVGKMDELLCMNETKIFSMDELFCREETSTFIR
jgi:hypothetical protein